MEEITYLVLRWEEKPLMGNGRSKSGLSSDAGSDHTDQSLLVRVKMTPNDEKVSKNFPLFSPRNLGRGWLPYPLDSSTPLEIPWSPSTSSMRTTMTGSSLGDLMRMGPSLVITWTRTLRQTGQWWTGWLGSSSYSAKSADPWKWVRWRGGVGGQKWGRGKGAAWWVREGKSGREGMIWIEGMKLFWK